MSEAVPITDVAVAERASEFPAAKLEAGEIRDESVLRRVVDLVVGYALLVLFFPVIAIAALLVKLSSAGPMFFPQNRMGKNGRVFRIYRLRTMYSKWENQPEMRGSMARDWRVTPVGRILRATRLDKFPRILNLLRHDVSLIGPRPLRPELFSSLEEDVPNYRDRLRIYPGLTGLAQVCLPKESTIEDVRQQLAFDIYYIRRRSLSLDIRIVIGTLLKLFHVPPPTIRKLLRLPDPSTIERSQQLTVAANQEPAAFEKPESLSPDVEQQVARARRQLTGEIPVSEYLPVTDEVRKAVAAWVEFARTVNGVEPDESAVATLTADLSLQYHFGGQQVLVRRTSQGVVVLAAGPEAVGKVLTLIDSDLTREYAVEFPAPWRRSQPDDRLSVDGTRHQYIP